MMICRNILQSHRQRCFSANSSTQKCIRYLSATSFSELASLIDKQPLSSKDNRSGESIIDASGKKLPIANQHASTERIVHKSNLGAKGGRLSDLINQKTPTSVGKSKPATISFASKLPKPAVAGESARNRLNNSNDTARNLSVNPVGESIRTKPATNAGTGQRRAPSRFSIDLDDIKPHSHQSFTNANRAPVRRPNPSGDIVVGGIPKGSVSIRDSVRNANNRVKEDDDWGDVIGTESPDMSSRNGLLRSQSQGGPLNRNQHLKQPGTTAKASAPSLSTMMKMPAKDDLEVLTDVRAIQADILNHMSAPSMAAPSAVATEGGMLT
jgi:hypothetical protein